MARNGSGVYSLPAGSIVATGDDILPAQHNDPLNDIASDLNAIRPISSGGTGASSAAGALTALGITSTIAELNHSDGVTSNIQTQLNTKAPISSPTFTNNFDFQSTSAILKITDTDNAIAGALSAATYFYGSDGLAGSIGHIGSTDFYVRSNNKNTHIEAGNTATGTNVYIKTNNTVRGTFSDTAVTFTNPLTSTALNVEAASAVALIKDTDSPIAGSMQTSVRFHGSDGEAGSIGHITSTDFYVRSNNKNMFLDAGYTGAGSSVFLRTNNVLRFSVSDTAAACTVPLTVTGTASATTFSGSGASLTNLPAGNLTGDIAAARLTNAKVATGNAGTAVGDIAYLHCDNIVGYYGTAAGSTLHPAGVTDLGVTIDTGTVLSGTWRCLGANGPSTGSTLWRRES